MYHVLQAKAALMHNFQEGNEVGHLLAKEASKKSNINRLSYFTTLPFFVQGTLQSNKDGTPFIKLIFENICITLVELH